MRTLCQTVLAFLIFVNFSCLVAAQVAPKAPLLFIKETSIDFKFPFYFRRIPISDNTLEIRRELLDTNVIRFLASVKGLTASDLATIQISPGSTTNSVKLYQVSWSNETFKIMEDLLNNYAQQRYSHSKEFLFAGLADHLKAASITNLYLRAILTNQPWLPVSWFVKVRSETNTIKAGEIISITSFTTITNGREQTVLSTNSPRNDILMIRSSYSVKDGATGWYYSFDFDSNDQIEQSSSERCDVMDVDPKYSSIIKRVDDDVEAEIKRKNKHGLGTIHYFWRRKQEILKQKGFNWHSPAELNRETIYD